MWQVFNWISRFYGRILVTEYFDGRLSTLIPEAHSGAEHMPDQQPSAVLCLEGGLTLKLTAYIPHLEAVKGGGTLTFPRFPEQGGRSGPGGGIGQTSPERGPFNCSRRAVFTPNQTFPPPPSRCQACFNKHGPNSLALLPAAAWQVVHESWYLGMQPPAAAFIFIFFAGKCETRYNFQPSFACGDEREWVALTLRKDYFPRVNELIFHRYRLEPPLLCCA